MAEQKRQVSQISFDDVTEAAVGAVLRAVDAHRKSLELDNEPFKLPPIIFGIWIMPDDILGKLPPIEKRPGGK